MQVNDIIWTKKMTAVMQDTSQVLYLVGATGCSKSLVAGIKFMQWLYEAPKGENQFYMIFKDIGTGARNFLQNSDTFYNVFSFMRTEAKKTEGGLQFTFKGKNENKIVYILGADDKRSWSKVLGSNPDGLWLEELSVLHIDLIRELMGRVISRKCRLIATTNGGLPTQEFYTEFVNHAKVNFADTVPSVEMVEMLQDKPYMSYYHFNLNDDAPHLTATEKQNLLELYPIKSFYYNSKVLGVRGFIQGSAFAQIMDKGTHLIPYENINFNAFEEISLFIDVGSNKNVEDTSKASTVGSLIGYTKDCQRIVIIECWEAPATSHDDIIKFYESKIYPYWFKYMFKFKKIVIDNADAILVSTWFRNNKYNTISVKGCVKQYKGQITLVNRCTIKQQLILQERLLWSDRALNNYNAHTRLLTAEDGSVLDLSTQDNDINDTVDYGITENWNKITNVIERS